MRVEIALLGGFGVTIDGVALPTDLWPRASAALVKVLAMQPHRRMHPEHLIDALWPGVEPDAALSRLRETVHVARRMLGSRKSVVLSAETVALFPGLTVRVDVTVFEAAAEAALKHGAPSVDACIAAHSLYQGELLPGDRGEAWASEPRRRLQSRHDQLLRAARNRSGGGQARGPRSVSAM